MFGITTIIKKLSEGYKLENACVNFLIDSESGYPLPHSICDGSKKFNVFPAGHRYRFIKQDRLFHVVNVVSEEKRYFRLIFDAHDLVWSVEAIGGYSHD